MGEEAYSQSKDSYMLILGMCCLLLYFPNPNMKKSKPNGNIHLQLLTS
jgi:hypothetical protein